MQLHTGDSPEDGLQQAAAGQEGAGQSPADQGGGELLLQVHRLAG